MHDSSHVRHKSRFHAKQTSPWYPISGPAPPSAVDRRPGCWDLPAAETGFTAPSCSWAREYFQTGSFGRDRTTNEKSDRGWDECRGPDLITLLGRQKADQIIRRQTPWHRPRRSTGTERGVHQLFTPGINKRVKVFSESELLPPHPPVSLRSASKPQCGMSLGMNNVYQIPREERFSSGSAAAFY